MSTLLKVKFPIDIEIIRKVLGELPFLSSFYFEYREDSFQIKIHSSKKITVSLYDDEMDDDETDDYVDVNVDFPNVNAAIQWISEKAY